VARTPSASRRVPRALVPTGQISAWLTPTCVR